MERYISEIYLLLSELNWPATASASEPIGREFYPGLCSYSVFAMSFQGKLAASSSYGDFEACANLLQACFTLVVTNLQKACRLAVQVCCKLKLLSRTWVLLKRQTIIKLMDEFCVLFIYIKMPYLRPFYVNGTFKAEVQVFIVTTRKLENKSIEHPMEEFSVLFIMISQNFRTHDLLPFSASPPI
ncbi:hypothetical protein AVEN_1427-1 [Araneus ventricosus]|uniref:Uncharacterized protein n=1 Tax=Araneus ventricosus TaxID=182803 RepID=A0A4Y2V8B8_ARAVE|nr:hypothetical protein AVEN_65795-1 [Araneus ventricosus]GBO20326.1 hypothetical protein AVEN_1427-1 [Araneus ventricosus]